MLSDKVHCDYGTDFDDTNYKSCFARSVVVSSQCRPKLPEFDEKIRKDDGYQKIRLDKGGAPATFLRTSGAGPSEVVLMKETFLEEMRNSNSVNSSRRTSICSSRLAEMPVQNLIFKTQLDTLQWQLKQTESSREMYRAVMKQVVTFLERAHRSLELLGTRISTNQQTVPRSRSEHQMTTTNDTLNDISTSTTTDDYTSFRDFTWRRRKKPQTLPEEIPPEKLSQEAFRLLRTAQSLLDTREPDLAHTNNDINDEIFLAQLAKEFPRTPENQTHRSNSYSSSPHLTSDKEIRISTAFNRKLSLQRTSTDYKRNSFHTLESPKHNKSLDSACSNLANNNCCIMSSTLNDMECNKRNSINSIKSLNVEGIKNDKLKYEPEKSNSPPMSSVSSAEDESGFSSMNSFQELGIPLINSTILEEKNPKTLLLKSMLHDNVSSPKMSSPIKPIKPINDDKQDNQNKDFKLWQKPEGIASHRRWSSVPVENIEKPPLKVLWV